MRTVVLHYHLFKNAGSSVDELLKSNFPEGWVTREFFEDDQEQNLREVSEWISNQINAVAFSSHTAMLPPPQLIDTNIIPVIFYRHPIDRIVSAYMFEKVQENDGFGAVLARSTSLAGYIDVRLSLPMDIQCRNFHANRLGRMFYADENNLGSCALRALDELPFIGLVEEFDKSVMSMADLIREAYPEFKVKKFAENVMRNISESLDERVESIRRELGAARYERLLEANSIDMMLYERVKQKYRK